MVPFLWNIEDCQLNECNVEMYLLQCKKVSSKNQCSSVARSNLEVSACLGPSI